MIIIADNLKNPLNYTYKDYYESVNKDFKEVKNHYPFSLLMIPPTNQPVTAIIKVIAVNSDLIKTVRGKKDDFLGVFSKELYVVVPFNYRKTGCEVYGGKWIDLQKIKGEDRHFFNYDEASVNREYGLKFCVGVPRSFQLMKNVILENIKTAENMLIAYERIMSGTTDKLELIAYAHGDKGVKQFEKNSKKYLP